jgi:hypothetical protein
MVVSELTAANQKLTHSYAANAGKNSVLVFLPKVVWYQRSLSIPGDSPLNLGNLSLFYS